MFLVLPLIMGCLVGFALGFFGSGGSVLGVPILVYILGMEPKEAIASSLIIVGVTAMAGLVQKIRLKHICYKVAVAFGLFGVMGSFGGAKISVYLSGTQQLFVFAILMLVSSISMLLKPKKMSADEGSCDMNLVLASVLGLFVGVLTGLVGVGGGFLIIPALVALGGLNIRLAMGTSLLIISFNAIAGVVGYIGLVKFNAPVILVFVLGSSLASFIGAKASAKVKPARMEKAFSVFILLVGVFLLFKNIKGL